MSTKQLVIQHDLSQLSTEQLEQYKRDVSAFVGLDPDLNGLDTIWMDNEHGPGRSLVLYARRGTAEILREKQGIEVSSLTSTEVHGSIVYTATGKNKDGRQEIATGSKSIMVVPGVYLTGKPLDNAIMTASTRALRRLTMQFTKLGLLDESEIDAVQGSTANPAAGAQLAGSPVVMPPAPTVPANNAPGKDITTVPVLPTAPVVIGEPFVGQQDQINAAMEQVKAKADKKAGTPAPIAPVTTTDSMTSTNVQPDIKPDKPKRARRPRNTVNMDGPEPEVVSSPAPTPEVAPAPVPAPPAPVIQPSPAPPAAPEPVPASVPTQAVAAVPPQVNPADFPGKPTLEQMADYRKRVGVYTAELPSSENMGSVQKMRAFITRQTGQAPQYMTTDQWEEMLSWFESFAAKNSIKGLVKYINDSLGVK